MQTTAQIMAELERLGTEQTRKTYIRHGAPADRLFGVKIGDLKPIVKRLKGQQELALSLYDTGNSDAMYLAGLVVDGAKMTKKRLDDWAKKATWYMISEYTVPWAASDHPEATQIACKWIRSKSASVAASGWATYATVMSVRSDDTLDLAEIKDLMTSVESSIHTAPNRVAYAMNGFVISAGSYVTKLHNQAKKTAKTIGLVQVDMGDTACKVPLASETLEKIEAMGRVGLKRKNSRC